MLSWLWVGISCIFVVYLIMHIDVIQVRFAHTPKKKCYIHYHAATTKAPYTVREYIELIQQKDGRFTGVKRGTQSGPDMTNGYEGTLSGVIGRGGALEVVFDYVVEGSRNRELEIYQKVRGPQGRYGPGSEIGVTKLRYPLIEREGVLVPDTTQKYSPIHYAGIVCEKSE